MVKVFLLSLGLVIAILNTMNCCMASEYFGKALTLRAARPMVSHPVVVPNLKPLKLLTIKDVDDAWRIGHWLADASNYYQYEIDNNSKWFSELKYKDDLTGGLAYHLYRRLENADPSLSLVKLEDLLFRDYFFKESALALICSGYEEHEFPVREAVRLGWLLYGLPIDKSK
jgi:hypothetical protein